MQIVLKRISKKPDYTIGKVYINNEYFCDSIEDKDRGLTDNMSELQVQAIKVMHKTAIPTGTYKVTYTYSNKYKKMMPLVNDVKGFTGIRIHSGNTADDSSGCIILGQNKVVGKVINSKITIDKFITILKKALDKKEKVELMIK